MKFKIQNKGFYYLYFMLCAYFVFCALSSGIFIMGCSSIKEGLKGFAGVSTKVLEEGRKDAITASYNLDYFTCFTKTLDTLKSNNSYIYANNIKRHMIAFYVSQDDTTPVGIFFKEIDAHNTGMEISSPSTYAKELFAQKLLKALSGK